jgi:hypothetical protein
MQSAGSIPAASTINLLILLELNEARTASNRP